jgi:hypothetical protein
LGRDRCGGCLVRFHIDGFGHRYPPVEGTTLEFVGCLQKGWQKAMLLAQALDHIGYIIATLHAAMVRQRG